MIFLQLPVLARVLLHSYVSLCCVRNLVLDMLLKTARLCDRWLQKCGAANSVRVFLEHPVCMYEVSSLRVQRILNVLSEM